MTDLKLNEPILEDDYPIYMGYWYVLDGEPRRASAPSGITVGKLKRLSGAKEIRRCDAVARKLPLLSVSITDAT